MHHCQGQRYEEGAGAGAREPAQPEQNENDDIGQDCEPGPRPPQARKDGPDETGDEEWRRQLTWPQ